ncbi:TfoX/Sxy family protein [Gordonia sp. NB41Y]|uniref:TfoX/Sxy family protein n=1 Tax=Gordonia sp. NB41Y TaxID=875808 RepID=UPI0002BDEE71|nr:TfoX/Sxy family protein [Gordonia sp. NB41Y]EMP12289.1 RNA methyltransferase [Gordonia sp. NB41Y]WLP88561.1 TfoX/Sxy family protein [Gordonia sp. NB41Y]
MAYDEELAFRIRALLATESNVDEKPMFGGLAFLINGNMAVTASSRGGLMVRVPPEQTESLLEFPHTSPMEMSGRELRGWIRVSDEGVRTDRQLTRWVTLGSDFARKLPVK